MSTGRRISIRGTVQGVGFRPWVYRLAREAGVAGTVRNDAGGVTIEAFGPHERLDRFEASLAASPPPAAAIVAMETDRFDGVAPAGFAIVASGEGTRCEVAIPPDLATCPDCLNELFDPSDRRYRYPFINCTNCGPRFTIVCDLPYDRPATTMAGFTMCPDCRAEYEDPGDRRFHAQPNACPACGPRLRLVDAVGGLWAREDAALVEAARVVVEGAILAAQGLGGFHLVVRADDQAAVERLRARKHRPRKPLAVMGASLDDLAGLVALDAAAANVLAGAEAPIVLLDRLAGAPVAEAVAPGNRRLGVMLPSTPLHHLLLAEIGRPVVATSGNRSDEPICTDPGEALDRLAGIADLFLVHDRPIQRHADDSVVVFVAGEPRPLRRARGWAPRSVRLRSAVPSVLAVGAHMKTVVGVSRSEEVFLSQHIGDMETPQAVAAFEAVIADLLRMLEAEPVAIVHDLHPDYPTTQWARRAAVANGSPPLAGLPTLAVQHHHAHLAACLADHGHEGRALGLTLDGTGYGPDGTVWGGEALLGDAAGYERVARLRPFRLLGGEAAVREPRRSAFALLAQLEDSDQGADLPPFSSLDARERRLLERLAESGFGSPWTSSAGRLFDGVASLAGLVQKAAYEGEAGMLLELAAGRSVDDAYPLPVVEVEDEQVPPLELDWRPLVAAAVADVRAGRGADVVAARFHNGLAAGLAEVARRIGEARVALSGGCFQNALLTCRARTALEAAGFEVLLHRRVPANDGGLALGQIAIAAARLEGALRDVGREVSPCV